MPQLKEWRLRPSPSLGDAQGLDFPPVVAQLLINRDITTSSEIESFFKPSLHDPALLPDMEPALHRLHKAIKRGETVGIFGDFDVDGVTGTALMAQGLSDLGATVVPYIPDRMTEGHGLSAASVRALWDRGVSVLVTVDCGVTSRDEVSLAQDLGMDVIITDHHSPQTTLPLALSVIDPKLPTSSYPFDQLSGGGLAFKLIQGLYELVGQPWKRDLLELAALSTVADLVPLKDENRFLVREGLKELGRTRRPGLLALYRQARIKPESIDAETISFVIAPRLNAAGRLESAQTTYRLLTTLSDTEAESLAGRLETLNRQRQRLTEEAYKRAREIVQGWAPLPPILAVDIAEFPPGVLGLVASRLVDEFYRPAVVMSRVDGVVRASARSIREFNMVEALHQCGDLFIDHGGHPAAAGFQMDPEHLPTLRDRLQRVAEDALGERDLKPILDIDAEVSVSSLVGETFRRLQDLEPFGMENPTPTFLTRNLGLQHARPVGAQGQHLLMKLKEGSVTWDAIAFRRADQWVRDTPMLDVVYTIRTEWRDGNKLLSLKVLDFRPSAGRE